MSASFITNDDIDEEVRRVVYEQFLSRGSPITRTQIADKLSLEIEEVQSSYKRLADAHILVLQPGSGEVLMANPFSAVPTSFHVSGVGMEWWGNCIWDALGILAMVQEDGSVQTSCPDCGEAIHLDIVSGELAQEHGVVHFAVPAAHWWDDIVFT